MAHMVFIREDPPGVLRLEPDSDTDNQPLRHICQQNLNFEAVSVGSVGGKFLF